MSEAKVTRNAVVENPEGIHARAATLIAETVRRFDARVTLIKGGERANGTDVLQILSLGAGQGEQLALEAEGPAAEAVLDAVVELMARKFDDGRI
jgi:phosphocarrier protein HPr